MVEDRPDKQDAENPQAHHECFAVRKYFFHESQNLVRPTRYEKKAPGRQFFWQAPILQLILEAFRLCARLKLPSLAGNHTIFLKISLINSAGFE